MKPDKTPAEILARMEFFRDFTGEEIDRLLAFGSWIKFASGQPIVMEGDDDIYLYVLVRGQVHVVKNRTVLAVLESGDSFGEIGALARTPRTASVIAHRECICLCFEPRHIDRLPTDIQLKLVRRLLYSLAARLTSLNRRFVV